MYSIQLVCLALAVLLIGTCQAQCCGRVTSLLPQTSTCGCLPATTCGCGPFVTPVSAPCNLNPLTVSAINSCAPNLAPVAPLAAYPLPCPCGCGSQGSCINVDQLINTLVNALVFSTTGGGKAAVGAASGEPLIGLDLLYKLAGGGLGVAGLSAGGINVLEASLGKLLG